MPRFGPRIGWGQNYNNNAFAIIGSNALTNLAYGFKAPPGPKTLSKVHLYLPGRAGAPTPANHVMDLRPSVGQNPGNSGTTIVTRALTSIPAVAPGIVIYEGFNTVVDPGNGYFGVTRNLEPVPGTNYLNFNISTNVAILPDGMEFIHARSVDGSVTWNAYGARMPGPLFEFSDGTTLGVPTGIVQSASAIQTHGTIANGVRWTVQRTIKVIAASCTMQRVGNPGSIEARFYDAADSLVATSAPYHQENLQAGQYNTVVWQFANPVTLTAANIMRLMLCTNGASGNGSNYWAHGMAQAMANDAIYLAAGPEGGTWQQTSTTNINAGSIVWVNTTGRWPPITLILDPTDPYPSSGGGAPRIGSRLGVFAR